MPGRPVRTIVFVLVAACLFAGALTLPQAQEPGRSDRDGITLTPALGTGDWFSGSPGVEIRPQAGGGLALRRTVRGHLLLITRGLPVDPDECYTALVRARALTPSVAIALYDESVEDLLAEDPVPATTRPVLHDVRFDPAGRARVTFAIVGRGAPVRATVDELRLVRREC
jgi:hypothetical protein